MAVKTAVKYYNTFILKKLVQGDVPILYNWYVEESRIRGGYNNAQTGLAPRAFLRSDNNRQEQKGNSIMYSGILNSRTGVNQTNQFPSGEDITRTVDPQKGTIQKLYAEDTNLIIFQENKVNKALIDKDAVYTQEGQPIQTASNVVIGAITPYAGEFGISTNPESFAVYGYRKYFADANQGAVLRLSQDGITEISAYGMYDFFRDTFSQLSSGSVVGGWDIHNKCYTIAIKSGATGVQTQTLNFDEQVQGWTSRFSYDPNNMVSVQNNFYSTNSGGIYQHYSEGANRAQFYGNQYNTSVTVIFNAQPSLVKNFQTLNYEGGGGWFTGSVVTNTDLVQNQDQSSPIGRFVQATTLQELEDQLLKSEFKKKEDKYFANLYNTSAIEQGEVIFGNSISGVKGYTAQVTFEAENTSTSGSNELFAVSTNYKDSSY